MENKICNYKFLSNRDKSIIRKWIIERMTYAINQITIERNLYMKMTGIELDDENNYVNPIKKDTCLNVFAIDALISISYDMLDFKELFDFEHVEEYTDMFLRIFGIHGLCKPNVYERFVEILRGMEG